MEIDRDLTLKILTAYYAILQSLHLLTLARAGILMLSGQTTPFPILPPPKGWGTGTLPFMFGLAGMDVIGILLGLLFAYRLLIKGRHNRTLGLLSLSIFISGAIVFAAGTLPSGAWGSHPFAYWSMVVLFLPAGWLYFCLLREPSHSAKASREQ